MKRISMVLGVAVLGAMGTLLMGQGANTRVALPGAAEPNAADASKPLSVIAPETPYVKVDAGAVMIRFLGAVQPAAPGDGGALAAENEKRAKSTVAAFGIDAVKSDLLAGVAADEVVDKEGKPKFQVFNFADKKPLTAKAGKAEFSAGGGLDIAAFYPDVKTPGTYVVTWKNATPLVVNYLYSPGRRKLDLDQHRAQIDQIPEPKRSQILSQFAPVVIHITALEYTVIKSDQGEMKGIFYYDVAPHTVDNWVRLSKDRYYDGTTFHRVIKGFMIQGGDALGTTDRAGTGGPGYEINAEFSDKKHVRGVLSMARSQDPNSAGSQFFIIHAKAEHLDNSYSAFGEVTTGLEVVDKIADTPVAAGESGTVKGPRPKIESVRVLPATAEMYGIK